MKFGLFYCLINVEWSVLKYILMFFFFDEVCLGDNNC